MSAVYDTHSLAEWLQMLSLAVSVYSACSAPYFLLVEAEVWLWPRPLTAAVDAVKPAAGRAVDRLLVEAVNARYALRDAAVWLAALLALLTISETTR